MITLQFPGMRPCAKARPRVTKHGTYMPHKYQEWRVNFKWLVRDQADCRRLMHEVPACPVSVSVIFATATGNMRPDIDNALGAILDGLQDAKVFVNDSQVREIHGKVVKAKKADCGITVTIQAVS